MADLGDHVPWHCNDMIVNANGAAYVGNLGWDDEKDEVIKPTVLVRIDPDGEVRIAAEDLANPNGMALTADGSTLLVSETFAGRISAFDVDEAGDLSNRRVWADFAHRSSASAQSSSNSLFASGADRSPTRTSRGRLPISRRLGQRSISSSPPQFITDLLREAVKRALLLCKRPCDW